MINQHCKNLSNSYKLEFKNNTVVWRPCCFFKEERPVDVFNVDQFLPAIDATSKSTSWLPQCSWCKTLEENQFDIKYPRKLAEERIPNDPTINSKDCVYLEISTDIRCNAACLICSEQFSTTWQQLLKDNKLPYNKLYLENKIEVSNETTDKILSSISLDKVRYITFLGGEPFYSNQHVQIMQHLINTHPDTKLISLEYLTNASIVPSEKILNIWKHFKEVTIRLSIDGVGPTLEYLRWPLKWNQINKTVDFLVHNTDVNLHVSSTITPLNALCVNELDEWANDIIPRIRCKEPMLVRKGLAYGIMGLERTPQPLREEIYQRYGIEHRVSNMLLNLPVNSYSAMLNYLNAQDKMRGVDWKLTFPNITNYFTT